MAEAWYDAALTVREAQTIVALLRHVMTRRVPALSLADRQTIRAVIRKLERAERMAPEA